MKIAQRTTHSEEETMALAAQLAAVLVPGDVVALDGELGAGKTCFVRGLARGLGVSPAAVSSPTFIIRQEYSRDGEAVLEHVDAYRLSGSDDLDTIGWDEMLSSRSAILAVEWPSRIDEAIPREQRIDVALRHVGEHERSISISAEGDAAERIRHCFHSAF